MGLACASSYTPRSGPEIREVATGSEMVYARDGRTFDRIEDAVRGNDQAEAFAQAYANGTRWGLRWASAGLVGISVGAAVAISEGRDSSSLAPGLVTLIAAAIVYTYGLVRFFQAAPLRLDAINAYNDAVAAVGAVPIPRRPTAFFYGKDLSPELLEQYDRVVVDPDQPEPLPQSTRAKLFAYVSLGEVNPSRAFRKDVQNAWILGKNEAWGSAIVDTRSEAWRDFVLTRVIDPAYQRGFRGFFFDTLDSFTLVTSAPDEVEAHLRGLASIIIAIERRHPDVKILLNRGFDLLPLVGGVDGLVVESLFDTWDPTTHNFVPVPLDESAALKKKLEEVRATYGLPITVIDYLPTDPIDRRRAAAQRIFDLGFDPWISAPALDEVGVGCVSGADHGLSGRSCGKPAIP
jgi:hypothetical protein